MTLPAEGMSILRVVIFVLALVGIQLSALQSVQLPKRSRGCTFPEDLRYVVEAKGRPDLAINYERVARFKLASRKTNYRLNEMISIDFAMLNVSPKPVFFKELSAPDVRLVAYDDNGVRVKIANYVMYQLGVSKETYTLLKPNTTTTSSLNLLVGCKERDAFMKLMNDLFNDINRARRMGWDVIVFERELFISWGDACLDVLHPGAYSVVAEVTNEHVVGSPCEPQTKTAVGTIRSTPLKIDITE